MNRTTIFLLIMMVLIALITFGYYGGIYTDLNITLTADAKVFLMITLAGAFGGLLYTAREDGFTLPHRDPNNKHVWKLGWVSDCAYGIAGGYVVFLILPTDPSPSSDPNQLLAFLKPLALALVGGYGGRGLVDRALANIAKDAKEAVQTAKETKAQMDQIQETDTLAKKLVTQHLDENAEVQDVAGLQQAVKEASLAARFEIFKEAREIRKSNWKENPTLMERTVPVFEALIENVAGEEFHRTHGQLGYALKDKPDPDWEGAYKQLSEAIKLRDADGAKGFLMYEFNRAICGIKLQKDKESVLPDIKAAAARDSLNKKIMQMEEFKKWAETNELSLENLDG